ncbi:hypothetical protein LEP1GSC096_0469 [Leptospira interrogans serovar Hebdomadis str. R499]|nr:hypothetical protein LEP1GSC096_0469 [Leptospira interrogans serovar Hebdomadis str. R499]
MRTTMIKKKSMNASVYCFVESTIFALTLLERKIRSITKCDFCILSEYNIKLSKKCDTS